MTGLNDKPEESADDVIAEIDVVLTDELKSLYLLQYPSRLKNIPPYSADELQQIKFKPEREELQIQLGESKEENSGQSPSMICRLQSDAGSCTFLEKNSS